LGQEISFVNDNQFHMRVAKGEHHPYPPLRDFRKNLGRVLFSPFLFILLIVISFFPQVSLADDNESEAVKAVQEYGGDKGGRETIASLIEIYMLQMKPNSEVGVNIRGWYSIHLDDTTYLVVFSYIERQLEEWKWQVQMKDKKIKPLNGMAASFSRMAEIF
jgi:hypothetical protein